MSKFESLIFYFMAFGLAILFFSLHKQKNKLAARIGVIISIIIPALVAGMRYDVGTDYLPYYGTFIALQDYSNKWIITDERHLSQERGFLMIAKFLCHFLGPKGTFGAFAFIIILILMITLFKQYKGFELTLFYALFLFGAFISSFNILRQAISLVILFWGLQYVYDGKLTRYALTVAVASLFHVTSFAALPIYFLWNGRKERDIKASKKILLFVSAIILVMLWQPLLSRANNLIDNFYVQKYAAYLTGNDTNNRSFYLKLFLGVFFLLMEKRYKKYDARFGLCINMYMIGVILEFTGFYITFVKRLGDYYCTYSSLLLLSSIPLLFQKERNKVIARIGVCAYQTALFLMVTYFMNQGGLFPYRF